MAESETQRVDVRREAFTTTGIDNLQLTTDNPQLTTGPATYRRLLGYSARYWPIAIVAAIGMVFDAACGSAFTLIIKPMLDNLFVVKDATTIFWMPIVI